MTFLSTVMDFFYQNFILLLLSLFIITVILMFFIKIGTALIISTCIVVVMGIAATFVVDQTRYTTFQDAFSEQLNRDTDVRQISITAHNQYPEIEASTTIEDEENLEAIINGFMGLELKEDKVPNPNNWNYTISITTNNQIREGLSVTDRLTFNVNDSHINNYEVVDERNHLKPVTSLIERDEVEWNTER